MESSANRQYYLNETVQSALKLQNTLRNENLTWETKLSSNVGIDASLFNSRSIKFIHYIFIEWYIEVSAQIEIFTIDNRSAKRKFNSPVRTAAYIL